MGVSAAVAVAVGTYVYSAVDNEKHAQTNESNAANVAQDNANAEIAAANTQEQQKLNAQANVTATAQARVRAISNPDGDTIMTSPLGKVGLPSAPPTPSNGQGQANLNAPPPSPGMITSPGKSTIGG